LSDGNSSCIGVWPYNKGTETMGDMTTIGEILEFAIGREIQAAEFYMAMAERVKGSPAQEFFENLVTEELEHKSRVT